jgi:hypothetical protein
LDPNPEKSWSAMTLKYQCPECAAILKPSKPVPAGKKIRCPKCDNLFAPEEEKPAAAVAPTPADDEDEEGQVYRFADSGPPPEKPKGRTNIYEEKLRDRFPKTKRRPAQVICTGPANALLAAAIVTCLGALGFIVVYMFPIIFSEKALPGDELAYRWMWIAIWALVFVYAGIVVNGAYNMSQVESYTWAVAGCLMAVVPVTLWFYAVMLPTGIWCIMTLRKPEVQAGFFEKREE